LGLSVFSVYNPDSHHTVLATQTVHPSNSQYIYSVTLKIRTFLEIRGPSDGSGFENPRDMISSLFCDVTQRRLVDIRRRFRTTYRSHLQGSSSCLTLVDGTINCYETYVNNYKYMLRNIPEDRRSHIAAEARNPRYISCTSHETVYFALMSRATQRYTLFVLPSMLALLSDCR
jgi:hypothetical protein